MREICQKSLKFAPWMEAKSRKLPGVQPLEMRDWLQVDDAFGAQMAERARLISSHRGDVLQMRPEAEAACAEALELALTHLPEGFSRKGDQITRPDGVTIGLEGPPMEVLSRLVVEDFCILQKHEAEHVLTAALLCFPASWSLAEKFGHPLSMIHDPVAPYTALRGARFVPAARLGQSARAARRAALFEVRASVDLAIAQDGRGTVFDPHECGADE